jgi:protein-L-isoaspartate O-methyltransferase
MNRADFIPSVIWTYQPNGSGPVPVNRADEPERWQALIQTEEAIVTQVDDGEPRDGHGQHPTSSSSGLKVMTLMLDLLDAQPGMNVLEIGAGTGYNAALIAEAVNPGHVTTMEIDPSVARHARSALRRVDLPVTVVTGDGAIGYPPGAPYDRVICTASAVQVPYAWVQEARPGARIVLPFVGSFRQGPFLCLTVHDDATASGYFHRGAAFMRLRNQRDPESLARTWDLEPARSTTTRAYHLEPFTDFNAAFAVSTRLPKWRAGARPTTDGLVFLLSDYSTGSWAAVFPAHDGRHRVAYEGPRQLWRDLDTAYRWWIDSGRPSASRFGLTVTPLGQRFWLDNPDNVLPAIGEQDG